MAAIAAQIRELEDRLLAPELRASRDALEALISRDFVEFGSNGQVYDRQTIVSTLLAETQPKASTMSEFQVRVLSPDVVLATYRTSGSMRSSIWRLENDGWRIVFHQGTPAK